MSSKCTKLLVPLLFLVALVQLTLLYVALIVPEVFRIEMVSTNGNLSGWISREVLVFLGNMSNSGSLKFSRILKNHAARIQSTDRATAKDELRQALRIQQKQHSAPWQAYLDSMESIDTLDQLSDLEILDGNLEIARELLKECFLLAKKDNIYWQIRPLEKYLKLIQASTRKLDAEEVSECLRRWRSVPLFEFSKYNLSRKEALKHLPAGLEHGAAVPFLVDFNRMMERNYAFSGRMKEALLYAEQCVRLDTLLPQSSWQKPTDLAELALVYTELEQFAQASSTYRSCINMIIQSANPDVLPILPQRLAIANLALDMGRTKDFAQARESSEEIVSFLEKLKHQDKLFPIDHRWQTGDLVQVMWDERWWSGIVAQIEEGTTADLKTHRVKIHFVGFPSTQDDWFELSEIRQHPPYGFANPQGEVPAHVWTMLNHSLLH